MSELIELVSRVAELERRVASMVRHGSVEEVDHEKHLVRIRLGEGETPFLGPWVPYGQVAGDLKVHAPPSVGQQMTMLNPSGDFRQAIAMPFTWSDANSSPSQSGDERVLTFGSATIMLKANSLKVTVGGASFELTADKIEMLLGSSGFSISSSEITATAAEIITDGATRLDRGQQKVSTAAGLAQRVYAKP